MKSRMKTELRVNLSVLALVSFLTHSVGVMATPQDFDDAKRAAERIYSDHPEDFYCGCRITWRNGGKDLIDGNSCGYQPRKDPVRAQRVEWEHVVPASWFGQPMACWKSGGRQNCSKHDSAYQHIEGDLHNLTPAVGEVNGDRGNLPFGLVAADKGRYGKCGTRVDRETGKVEPRDEVKGDAARIAFYMSERYRIKIDDAQMRVLLQWAQQDPVDAWERERDNRVAQQMGWHNPYVAQAGKIALPHVEPGAIGNVAGAGGSAEGDGPKIHVSKESALNEQIAKEKSIFSKKMKYGALKSTPSAGTSGSALIQGVRGNRNSKVFHYATCPGYDTIKPDNRVEFASAAEAQNQGYHLARNCH